MSDQRIQYLDFIQRWFDQTEQEVGRFEREIIFSSPLENESVKTLFESTKVLLEHRDIATQREIKTIAWQIYILNPFGSLTWHAYETDKNKTYSFGNDNWPSFGAFVEEVKRKRGRQMRKQKREVRKQTRNVGVDL